MTIGAPVEFEVGGADRGAERGVDLPEAISVVGKGGRPLDPRHAGQRAGIARRAAGRVVPRVRIRGRLVGSSEPPRAVELTGGEDRWRNVSIKTPAALRVGDLVARQRGTEINGCLEARIHPIQRCLVPVDRRQRQRPGAARCIIRKPDRRQQAEAHIQRVLRADDVERVARISAETAVAQGQAGECVVDRVLALEQLRDERSDERGLGTVGGLRRTAEFTRDRIDRRSRAWGEHHAAADRLKRQTAGRLGPRWRGDRRNGLDRARRLER